MSQCNNVLASHGLPQHFQSQAAAQVRWRIRTRIHAQHQVMPVFWPWLQQQLQQTKHAWYTSEPPRHHSNHDVHFINDTMPVYNTGRLWVVTNNLEKAAKLVRQLQVA